MDKSQRLYNINENILIAKNRKPSNSVNKSALKYNYYDKKGYKKDRC